MTTCSKCGTELYEEWTSPSGGFEATLRIRESIPPHARHDIDRCLTFQLAKVTAERDEARALLKASSVPAGYCVEGGCQCDAVHSHVVPIFSRKEG
jgi:hypothetical protein